MKMKNNFFYKLCNSVCSACRNRKDSAVGFLLVLIFYSIFYSILHYKYLPHTVVLQIKEIPWRYRVSYSTVEADLVKLGIINVVQLALLEEDDFLNIHSHVIRRSSVFLKQKLMFDEFKSRSALIKEDRINENVYSIDKEILSDLFGDWKEKNKISGRVVHHTLLKTDLWNAVVNNYIHWKMCLYGSILMTSLISAVLVFLVVVAFYFCIMKFILELWITDSLIYNVFRKRYVLDINACQVYFDWEDNHQIGQIMYIIMKFYTRTGRKYEVSEQDYVRVDITVAGRIVMGGDDIGESKHPSTVTFKFLAKEAGLYKIRIFVGDDEIKGSPFFRTFTPDIVHPENTFCDEWGHTLVAFVKESYFIRIDPRDQYQNSLLNANGCSNVYIMENVQLFHAIVTDSTGDVTHKTYQSSVWYELSSVITFDITFMKEGYYSVHLFYDSILLENAKFDCVVLNDFDKTSFENNIINEVVIFNVKLVRVEAEPDKKPRNVTLRFSFREPNIMEYKSKTILTFDKSSIWRIVDETFEGEPMFMCLEPNKGRYYFASYSHAVITATCTRYFSKFLGNYKFQNKRLFFLYQVKAGLYYDRYTARTKLRVDRTDILESSMQATAWFDANQWCKKFVITYGNEIGVDHGGLLRDWIYQLSTRLFDPKNGLFIPFTDSPQGFVHPNKELSGSESKLKYYQFAGQLVAKCLYECSFINNDCHFINARLTRSFLAQILGNTVNHKHFKIDDPEYYSCKVKYILENDVEDMDLYFAEEEYDKRGQLTKVVDLIPDGKKTKVTNATKLDYVNSLANYRLCTSVKDQIEAFREGLRMFVPDHLLQIFNENEFALVCCGLQNYNVNDLRKYHTVYKAVNFERITNWFWEALSNFTTEDIARLLQFTTGSAVLPPGGFQDLVPKFTIIPATTYGALPTAQTCFNTIYLSNFDSYEEFKKALMTAIYEGSEGFFLC